MKERPIIFNGDMVRSILDGRKTQTRRVVKPQPFYANGVWQFQHKLYTFDCWVYDDDDLMGEEFLEFARNANNYGQPGDLLYVRENAYICPPNFSTEGEETHIDNYGKERIVSHSASMCSDSIDIAREYGVKQTPSIHMPKWASRIKLEITDIRIERLQNITEEDAIAEGIESDGNGRWKIPPGNLGTWSNPVEVFFELWDTINGKKKGRTVKDNPWVWVVEFKRIDK